MTLETLLDRALIKTYDRWAYFRDVQLVGESLLVPHVYRADAINRMFLARLRECCPALTVKAVTAAPPARDAEKAHHRSAFKKGKAPRDVVAAAVQRDMFGGDD